MGILFAFIFASFVLEMPLTLWLPSTIIALFSLFGDRIEIQPKYRLLVQFICTFCFIIPVRLLTFSFQPSMLSIFFLIIFIVGTANWYNFMDGINGIASITAIVGFGLLAFFIHISGGDNRFTILSISIVFSCLGLLPFNFPKAKIFMGDVGSIFLGFVFACMVVILSKDLLEFLCLVSFLFPFYSDELITMAVRINDGENLFEPHRRHFYQLLANEMKIDHWKISVGYGIVQLLIGLSILFAKHFGILIMLSLIVLYFNGAVWVNYILRVRIAKAF